jgi:(2R)-sulfolactate sulfo-lyase subunit alpha
MEETVPKAPDFLVHEVEDTVGVVVVEEAGKGKTLEGWLMAKDSTLKLKSKESILLGHKVALNNIKKGDTIIKYGHDIGKAIADIAKGGHVHVHNVKTKRW